MDILEVIAASLNWTIYSSVNALRALLELNYEIATVVIQHAQFLYTVVKKMAFVLVTAVSCTASDFIIFISELLFAASTVTQYIVHILATIASCFLNFFYALLYLIFKIYSFFAGVINVISSQISILVEILKQMAILVFSAVILLLQLLPNFLIFVISSFYFGVMHVEEAVVKNAQSLKVYGKSFLLESIKTWQVFLESIPMNAYLGLVLLLLLYLNHKTVCRIFILVASHIQFRIFQLLTYLLRNLYVTVETLFGAFAVLRYLAYHLMHEFQCLLRSASRLRLPGIIIMPLVNFSALFRTMFNFFAFLWWTRRELNEDTLEENHDNEATNGLNLVNNDVRSYPTVSSLQRKPLRSIKLDISDDEDEEHEENENKTTSQELINEMMKQLESERDRHLCIVCQDRPKSMILLPCRHLCMCQPCCGDFTASQANQFCPICRHRIFDIMHVFI